MRLTRHNGEEITAFRVDDPGYQEIEARPVFDFIRSGWEDWEIRSGDIVYSVEHRRTFTARVEHGRRLFLYDGSFFRFEVERNHIYLERRPLRSGDSVRFTELKFEAIFSVRVTDQGHLYLIGRSEAAMNMEQKFGPIELGTGGKCCWDHANGVPIEFPTPVRNNEIPVEVKKSEVDFKVPIQTALTEAFERQIKATLIGAIGAECVAFGEHVTAYGNNKAESKFTHHTHAEETLSETDVDIIAHILKGHDGRLEMPLAKALFFTEPEVMRFVMECSEAKYEPEKPTENEGRLPAYLQALARAWDLHMPKGARERATARAALVISALRNEPPIVTETAEPTRVGSKARYAVVDRTNPDHPLIRYHDDHASLSMGTIRRR